MSQNSRRNVFPLLSIILFLALLLLPSLFWGAGKLFPETLTYAQDYDLGENRNMAAFPTQYSSDYGIKLEACYNDHLPFRSAIISANRSLTAFMEKPYDEVLSPLLVSLFHPSSSMSGSDSQASLEPVYLPPKVYNNLTIQGRDGWLFLASEENLNDYLGNNPLSTDEMEEYMTLMVQLQEVCSRQGKELYFFIPPNKAQVYHDKMPSYTVVDAYTRIQRLVDHVKSNSTINILYPLDDMLSLKETLPLYLKTDTHWNEAGAYIGVQSLYSLMGIEQTEIQSIPYQEKEFDTGDLIRMGNLDPENFPVDTNFEVDYKPEIGVTVLDETEAGGSLYKTVSTSENDRNFLIIGDSYRIFMAKYLSRDFRYYTQVDKDFVSDPKVGEALQEADIIVIECVERFSHTLLTTLKYACEHLQKQLPG